jgi:hypothetical protein
MAKTLQHPPDASTSSETSIPEEKKGIDEDQFQQYGTTFVTPVDISQSSVSPFVPPAPRRTISDLLHDLTGRYPGLLYVVVGCIPYGIGIYSGHLSSLKEFIFATLATLVLWFALAFFGKKRI